MHVMCGVTLVPDTRKVEIGMVCRYRDKKLGMIRICKAYPKVVERMRMASSSGIARAWLRRVTRCHEYMKPSTCIRNVPRKRATGHKEHDCQITMLQVVVLGRYGHVTLVRLIALF